MKNSETYVIEMYNKLGALSRTENAIGLSKYKIRKILISNNIRIIPNKESIRKDFFNQNYFSLIDNEGKAYFLGLIAADGHVNQINGAVRITLQSGDIHILKELQKEVNSSLAIRIRKPDNPKHLSHAKLNLFSKIMVSDLKKLGLEQNKSLTLKPPKIDLNNKELVRHFIRGYFDGDGGLSQNYRKLKNGTFLNLTFSITSTLEMCLFIKNILEKETNSTVKLTKRFNNATNTYTICVYGNRQIIYLLDWLYKECKFRLNRKFDIYNKVKKAITEKLLSKTTKYKNVHFNKKIGTYSYEFYYNGLTYKKQGLKSELEALELLKIKHKEITGKEYENSFTRRKLGATDFDYTKYHNPT